MLVGASLGGGAARALLNLAASSADALAALRLTDAKERLQQLADDPTVSANVRGIALQAISTIEIAIMCAPRMW